jgi:hypothetical protein
LFVAPLLAAGCESAQAILNLFAPDDYTGSELFDGSTGGLVPLLVGIGGAGLVAAVATSAAARRRARPAAWWIVAVLPLLAFAIQEHVEYALGHGEVPWTLAAQPTFAVGLLLQLPFAAAAYIGARLLLRLAESVTVRFAPTSFSDTRVQTVPAVAVDRRPARTRLPGDDRLNRGPPVASLA